MPTTAIQLNHFDRGKPFYPLVMNYLVLLLGFKEIAVRGVVGPRDIPLAVRGAMSSFSGDPKKFDIQETTETLTKLLGPLGLRSEFQNDSIVVDADEVAKELSTNFDHLVSSTLPAAGSLLILALELTKNKPYHDKKPLWEFLRHCRHAAAHGSSFNFVNGEPRCSAQWGHFNIDPTLQGTPLFKGKDGKGLLIQFDFCGTLNRRIPTCEQRWITKGIRLFKTERQENPYATISRNKQ